MAVNITPVILSALELKVHFGEQIILDKASLSVHEGDRIGLVGRNGAGKSTFLKIISGLLNADSGEIAKKKDLIIGFLSQEFTLDESKNVYDNILDGAEKELNLIHEYDNTDYDSSKNIFLKKKYYNLIRGILRKELICLLTL